MMNSPWPRAELIAGGARRNGRFRRGFRGTLAVGEYAHGLPDPSALADTAVVTNPLLPREALLAAAAQAVVAAFRDSLERRALPPPATAALRLLESALEPYFPAADAD